MRVPNCGQDLIERRIVREGKRLAAVMLADYADPPGLSLAGLGQLANSLRQQLGGALRAFSLRF